MDWYDATDNSRPIISPQAEITSYLHRHGEKRGFGIRGGLLILETGGDIMRLRAKYEIKEEPFQLPAFLGKKPIFIVKGDPDVQMTERFAYIAVRLSAQTQFSGKPPPCSSNLSDN